LYAEVVESVQGNLPGRHIR
ncbi:hypothetical protein CLOP_g736, partial [Closterium sp. NIES-67]